MENEESSEEIADVIRKISNVHCVAGPVHQKLEKFKAYNCMQESELQAIYHLVESHVPGLRLKAVLRYEKILTSGGNPCSGSNNKVRVSLCKNNMSSNCANSKVEDNVNNMLEKIKEMPAEWTLIQLTPQFNAEENENISIKRHCTNSLTLTVFNCGQNQPKPFCVKVEKPIDEITGSTVELMYEAHSIMHDNRNTLISSKTQTHFKGISEKQNYYARRKSIDDRLKMLVKDLQDLYLKEWKCFMVGKYVDKNLGISVEKHIKEFFQTEAPSFNLTEKMQTIVQYLIKSAHYLKLVELKSALQTLSPDKKLQKQLGQFIRNISNKLSLSEQKRHPLILILDDSLDCFPWEMMDILSNVSVSRLPSLHLAYALFQEYKDSIKNGFKIVKNPENGTYVVNPDTDLKGMQNRILSFYEYWLPTWQGVFGCKPTEERFEKMLVSSETFAYNGHGGGWHLFPMNKVERMRINAIVLLFGCSSTKLNILSPQVEMYSSYQMYLIACSPCIIGNLWEVTDLDTDILTTELLSTWIPNPGKVHWKNLDKTKWRKGEIVHFRSEEEHSELLNQQVHEPELLKALSAAKKSSQLSFYLTKAGVVARGIPVKTVSK
ncbi:uncharacterized protein LOC135134157 [Zophobas morio]|uniref:uncharacterized protein LOC135134157 n=1 Tax=Zophobas morio TaxID=2755281 RepID=UPI003083CC02